MGSLAENALMVTTKQFMQQIIGPNIIHSLHITMLTPTPAAVKKEFQISEYLRHLGECHPPRDKQWK